MKIESATDIKIRIELNLEEAELLRALVQNPPPNCIHRRSVDEEDFGAELFTTLSKHTEKAK